MVLTPIHSAESPEWMGYPDHSCSQVNWKLTSTRVQRRCSRMVSDMKTRLLTTLPLTLMLFALPGFGQKKSNLQKPMAGPRATALRVTVLYISPDTSTQKVDRVQIGREMVVGEKSGPWLRVYANTDIEEMQSKDSPMFGTDETPPPVSGWIEAKGILIETTPNGDEILMGAAANEEALASDPRGPANAAASARLLYRRLVEMFPNSHFGLRGYVAGCRRPMADREAGRGDPAFRERKGPISARSDGRGRDEEDYQTLSSYALGGSCSLRANRQQAVRRLAGFAQVP